MASKGSTLRDRQIAAFKKILNLNEDTPETEDANNPLAPASILNSEGDPIWKVLCFDDFGRNAISSVLRVQDLRSLGVTLHTYVAVLAFSFSSPQAELFLVTLELRAIRFLMSRSFIF